MSDTKLIPITKCPFCGNEEQTLFTWDFSLEQWELQNGWCQTWLICRVCHCQGPTTRQYIKDTNHAYLADHQQVIKAWNDRQTDPYRWQLFNR